MVRLKPKDEKQDKEIGKLKKQLKELMGKYLKKRKKETKGEKGKYNKIKARITKSSEKASTKGEIAKLIALLKQGVGKTTTATAPQPIIPQPTTTATTGSIASRISTDTKKSGVGDPLKLWRELKTNWESVKDKYKNDTLTRDDIVNIYNKAKKLAGAVSDNTLLLISEITTMYGVGKSAYEYLMRFINKHTPITENPVTTETTTTTPPPPPTGGSGDGGGGGGETTTPTDTTPTAPEIPTGMPVEGEMRGQGLGRFSDTRAADTPAPKDRPENQSWTDYIKASMPSLETTTMMGMGAMAVAPLLGRLRGGRLAQRERVEPQEMDVLRNVREGVLRNVQPDLPRAMEAMRGMGEALRGARDTLAVANRRLRERGMEQDARGALGQVQQDTDFVNQPIPEAVGDQVFDMPRPEGRLKLPRGMSPQTALDTGRIPGAEGARPITRQTGMGEGVSADTFQRDLGEMAGEVFSAPPTLPSAGQAPPMTEAPQTPMASRLQELDVGQFRAE